MNLNEVFVPGGQPTVTYVPRDSLALEDSLNRAIDRGHSLVSVTGPTKSGKTVLCREVTRDRGALWLTGGDFKTESEFWDTLGQKLLVQAETESHASNSSSTSVEGRISLGASLGANHSTAKTNSEIRRRRYSPKAAALEALSGYNKVIIIDDFHYLDTNTQTSVIRALKPRIFDGLRVVVLAVPHRAYDAIKVESEMTGRVQQVRIGKWRDDELLQIGRSGFSELKVVIPDDAMADLAAQAFGSPHLMQTFCYDVCYDSGITATSANEITLGLINRNVFYSRIAGDTSKVAFERLAIGPRQRSDRIQRRFKSGEDGDIYILPFSEPSQRQDPPLD